jgi:glycosyltransferase involved in cell wall biosynthesis
MPVIIDAGDIIAGLAFLLSSYATWQTVSFNKKQKSLAESQEKLNNLLLEKENEDSLKEKRADLGASFIKLGSSKYRLKIWNKGASTARNVRIEFPEGNDVVINSEITDKFPMESLERHQSVELIAAVHMNTKRKHVVRLIWEDDAQSHNEKLSYPTL